MKFTNTSIKGLKPKAERYDVGGGNGLFIRVSPMGTKTWIFFYRHDGRQRRLTLGRYPAVGLARANTLHAEAVEKLGNGIDPADEALAEREEERAERAIDKSLKTVFEDYAADHLENLRTGAKIRRQFEGDVLPRWGKRPVGEITRVDIRKMLREKGETAPISANRLLACLRHFLNWCVDEEIIDANPAARIKPVVNEKERERERVLTPDEIKAIWAAAEEKGHPVGAFVQMLFLTAARRNEVAAMSWPELDIANATWTIPASRYKTKRALVLPLSAPAISIIETIRDRDDDDQGVYLFCSSRRGDQPISGFSQAKRLLDLKIAQVRAAAADLSGLSDDEIRDQFGIPDWRFHDIRRTAATGMRELGIDRGIVSGLLGHAESGITRIYDRSSAMPQLRIAVAVWARHLTSIVEGPPENVIPLRQAAE